MNEACRLAIESVENNWGGPFGAVIARDGGHRPRAARTASCSPRRHGHGEIEAIRKAVQVLNAAAPSISREHVDESTLKLVPRP
ncbi:nucleoside deaminase, partial [Rhodococcus hoagii]|nr:nucleoside deaminase [Prescottella equi]